MVTGINQSCREDREERNQLVTPRTRTLANKMCVYISKSLRCMATSLLLLLLLLLLFVLSWLLEFIKRQEMATCPEITNPSWNVEKAATTNTHTHEQRPSTSSAVFYYIEAASKNLPLLVVHPAQTANCSLTYKQRIRQRQRRMNYA